LFPLVAGSVAAWAFLFAAVPRCPADGPGCVLVAKVFRQNDLLGRGVNVLGYDPAWKDLRRARFKKEYFGLIQQAGFQHVRINLHPFRDGPLGWNDTIVPIWFETLDWALRHALAARLAVILDFHEFQAMGEDPAGNRKRFLAAWRQIAEHCKDAPHNVFFEILNEPNKKLTAELWNPLLREALGIIRRSNPDRTVIVGPTSWNSINDLPKLKLPEEDNNLIVTVHYYSPFPFTHQGAAWAGQNKTGVEWNGSEAERQAIVGDFARAQAWSGEHGRPIYLGEFGVYDKAPPASRARWTSFVARQAEGLRWSWAWWQFDGDFVLFDVRRERWVDPLLRALVPSVRGAGGAAGPAGPAGPEAARPELVEARKIWDRAPHSAFTDLARHNGRWWCVFREGQGHVSPDGALRVITSADGTAWESAALLKSPGEDLRDAKLCITPDGQLMLGGAGARREHKPESHQSYVWFSRDGHSWSEALPVADPNYWLWRVTWHKGACYGVGYDCRGESNVRLYRSQDGRSFQTLAASLFHEGYPNESSLLFLPDDTALCLLRRDGQPSNGLVGSAKPPYLDWTWKDTGRRIGGPQLLRLDDGRLIAAVRLYDGRARTSLCWLDPASGRLDECLALPSGGDTSYAGLVLHDGLLWVSYYSSHEGKTSIYLAKVKIPPRP
jgi:hypothetical protein